MQNVLIIKILLYTWGQVSERVRIKIRNIDFDRFQIRISQWNGPKDRIVPFPALFKELLDVHVENVSKNGAVFLFESSSKKSYTDRCIRKILDNYSKQAGITQLISPHKLRHFLFTWLKNRKSRMHSFGNIQGPKAVNPLRSIRNFLSEMPKMNIKM